KDVCKLDVSGIPRCFGGCMGGNCGGMCPTGYDPNNPNCCIQVGQACQFRDQCCNLAPCVPAPAGGFVCATPAMCVVAGGVCTVGAPPGPMGCCGGTQCLGSSQPGVFVCTNVGGSPDAGTTMGGDGG